MKKKDCVTVCPPQKSLLLLIKKNMVKVIPISLIKEKKLNYESFTPFL